jgi:hypothetical protein
MANYMTQAQKQSRTAEPCAKAWAALLCVALLFLASCGEHSFLDEVLGGVSSSSEGTGDYTLGFVEPLIKTTWGLSAPYNNMTPLDGDRHSAVGCNAVAVAQIMNFYKHPVRGNGQSEPYTTTTLGIEMPSVNFNVAYDWDNMLNTYRSDGTGSTEQQKNAVATLMYHAGVSVQMNYTASGSGAGSARIPRALTTFFGYDKSILWRDRSFYDDAEWDKMLREQLDAGLPVINVGASHIFIVDGYDNTGKFHFNWGERGSHDGYYFTNALSTPTRTVGDDQHVFINIKPDQGGASIGYEMVLREVFTASKISVPQNETITVNVNMRNIGTLESFPGGHIGVVLVDNNDNIVEFIGTRSASGLGVGNTWSTREINCYIPETVMPGQYRLRIVTKPNDGDWRIVELSEVRNGVPTSIDFEVK